MNTPPTPALLLGYVRVSTDRQDLSVEAQHATLQRAAAFKCPDAALRIFADEARSGATAFAERPGGAALLLAARQARLAGTPVAFIAVKLDRMGRDMMDVLEVCSQFEALEVRVILLDVDVDTRSAAGKLFLRIVAAVADFELSRIRERIQSAMDQKRSSGQLTGTVPYGWTAEVRGAKRYLVDHPGEQQWILHMAALRALGWTGYAIARDLNQRGVPTKYGAGHPMRLSAPGAARSETKPTRGTWTSERVLKILQSKTVRHWLTTQSQHAQAA